MELRNWVGAQSSPGRRCDAGASARPLLLCTWRCRAARIAHWPTGPPLTGWVPPVLSFLGSCSNLVLLARTPQTLQFDLKPVLVLKLAPTPYY